MRYHTHSTNKSKPALNCSAVTVPLPVRSRYTQWTHLPARRTRAAHDVALYACLIAHNWPNKINGSIITINVTTALCAHDSFTQTVWHNTPQQRAPACVRPNWITDQNRKKIIPLNVTVGGRFCWVISVFYSFAIFGVSHVSPLYM